MHMKKSGRFCALLLAALLCAGLAAAEGYSFPSAGVFVETQSDWTLLCPETLANQGDLLSRLGAREDVLRADWAAEGGVFDAYLASGAQVRLTCVDSDLPESVWMTDAQRQAFVASYDHAPYENVAFSEAAPGWLQMSWSFETEGATVRFFSLATVCQGALYRLTAAGAGLDAAALGEGCLSVLKNVSFLGTRLTLSAEEGDVADVTLPEPIADDGAVTPLSLPDFNGLSTQDIFTLTVRSLPGAELTLTTPTDSLRGAADANGLHDFTLSTKQTKVYAYTLAAKAEGRAASRMEIEIRRELTGEAREAAYRAGARAVDMSLYASVLAAPDKYAGQALSLRGKVVASRDLNGLPCVLVYSANPGTGVWRNPFWVLLRTTEQLEEGSIYNLYGDVRGDALPLPEGTETAEQSLAPVLVCHSVN